MKLAIFSLALLAMADLAVAGSLTEGKAMQLKFF
jgi:hypothetical protein